MLLRREWTILLYSTIVFGKPYRSRQYKYIYKTEPYHICERADHFTITKIKLKYFSSLNEVSSSMIVEICYTSTPKGGLKQDSLSSQISYYNYWRSFLARSYKMRQG